MAKREPSFKPLVIKTRALLHQLIFAIGDGSELSEAEIRGILDPNSPAGRLVQWEEKHARLCDTGRQRVLSEAGKLNSWKEYIKKHWNDTDGMKGWVEDHSFELFGVGYLGIMRYGSFAAFEQAMNEGIPGYAGGRAKWPKIWPFKQVRKAKKKARRGRR